MQFSKQSLLVRRRRFHGYHCPDGNTYIINGGSFKKYSKFGPTIHIIPNSYSIRIMFIIIIVRFFIISFMNGWKYEKVATNWDRVTHWCVYLICSFSRILKTIPGRKIWSGQWSAQARNVGSQCWLSILDRWSIEAWMIIAGLYWLVILAPKSVPIIGRKLLPELSRRSFKFIIILLLTIKFQT